MKEVYHLSSLLLSIVASVFLIVPSYAADEEILSRMSASTAPFIADSRNVKQFKAILLPEISKFVAGGEVLTISKTFMMTTAPSVSGEGWASSVSALSDSQRTSLPPTMPFPGDFSDPEKILWNSQAQLWKTPVWSGTFHLTRLQGELLEQPVQGKWKRVYPAALPDPPKLPQFFRDKFELFEPKALKAFQWLTFRFFGDEEDFVQVFSPLVSQSRQLTGSNRSDPFLRSLFSVDDMLGWSGKVEMVSPLLLGEEIELVPFITKDKGVITKDDQCQTLKMPASERIQHLPSGVEWSPRVTVKIELTQRDPFASIGRSVSYYDKESLQPVIRLVYDRSGELMKVITTALFQGEEGVVFPAITSVISPDGLIAETVQFDELSRCRGFSAGSSLSDFDPRRASTPVAPTPAKGK